MWQNEVNVLRVPQTTANIIHAQTVDQKEQLPGQNPKDVLMQSSQQNIYLTSQWLEEHPEYSAHDFRLSFLIRCYPGQRQELPEIMVS